MFEPSGREVVLTAAGEELLQTARALDDVWGRFESAIADLKGLKRGRLRVALVTTAKYFLPRLLGDFSRRYPELLIDLEIAEPRAHRGAHARQSGRSLRHGSTHRKTWS
ncbi:LysR substrate-binding domain-containing protein [Accumulibacter sp.]|uniref:LysR substrate-binding domain-containing protein n=1 Tax=Accumulibacter sp. TaxID=2053492 RepID=UPI002588F44F|nr:LysR substrate-binding domain-containing protein [Accumulibacter sp.]